MSNVTYRIADMSKTIDYAGIARVQGGNAEHIIDSDFVVVAERNEEIIAYAAGQDRCDLFLLSTGKIWQKEIAARCLSELESAYASRGIEEMNMPFVDEMSKLSTWLVRDAGYSLRDGVAYKKVENIAQVFPNLIELSRAGDELATTSILNRLTRFIRKCVGLFTKGSLAHYRERAICRAREEVRKEIPSYSRESCYDMESLMALAAGTCRNAVMKEIKEIREESKLEPSTV